MNKASRPNNEELRREYDFTSMKGGVRGKYAGRLAEEGSNLVLLEPEIAAVFTSDEAVNEALRGVLSAARLVRGKGGPPSNAPRPKSRTRSRAKERQRPRAARG